ncbi:MAG TPA: crosslink repair DNA glycosylase YcaQ family protein [Acidimicrobiales bacterium]|nr:crosslink repair DNA glycosylase YcaQ family protein [Acidimicrobiales bacterium]
MSEQVEMSRRDARRVALAAQGFADRRPTGRIDRRHFRRVLDGLATVQIDSVNVLTRSHELVFFARLGPYDRDALTRWLWSSREVFEYWGHEASLHPVERYPLLRWRMAGSHLWGGVRRAARDNPDLVAAALSEIAAKGPVPIGELEVNRSHPRHEGAWWGWGGGKRVVEHLFFQGQVTATRRNGFTRYYMLPEQWLPAAVLATPPPPEDEARRGLLRLAAGAHGVGTARDLADYYRLNVPAARPLLEAMAADGELVQVAVEGWREPAYMAPDARLPRRRLRARALLSPFDSLIWERSRVARLWDMAYRIEIYVPAPKRVHGYYVLPFLLGEDLVARVDLKADRAAGTLRARAAWAEPLTPTRPDRDEVGAELAAELAGMAAWLGLPGGVTVEPRGDLAPELARAVG